jgi:hypothetical protein
MLEKKSDEASKSTCAIAPITITRAEILSLAFSPLVSDMYDDTSETFTQVAEFAGFCEWKSETYPSLSIGWDWEFVGSKYTISGSYYTNFDIVSLDSKPLSESESNLIILDIITKESWVDVLIGELNKKYTQ